MTAVPRKSQYKKTFKILSCFKNLYAYLFFNLVILPKGEQHWNYVPATGTSNSKILSVCAQLRHSSCVSKLNSNIHFKSKTQNLFCLFTNVLLQWNQFQAVSTRGFAYLGWGKTGGKRVFKQAMHFRSTFSCFFPKPKRCTGSSASNSLNSNFFRAPVTTTKTFQRTDQELDFYLSAKSHKIPGQD